MRIKKIRGQKRLWKRIEEWKSQNLELDLEYLKSSQREYVKIWIHPFSSISMLNSEFPEPKGKTRKLILNGLIEIYDSWKAQLETLGQPYYLKIWLFDPHFSKSQVVCAIGDFLNFYDITFHKPEDVDSSKLKNVRKSLPDGFNWELHWDEYHLKENEVGEPEDYYSLEDYRAELKNFNRKLKRPHRTTTYSSEGEKTEYYSFKTGQVWIGDKL